MSYKTRRILFFVTTIFLFANISQAKYLLVEVDSKPKIDDILPGVLPVNLTTDAESESDDNTKSFRYLPLLDSDSTGTFSKLH